MVASPNPFNPVTTLTLAVPRDGHALLSVYDVTGRHVRTLVNRQVAIGEHEVVWNGRDDAGRSVASGVYIIHMTTPGETTTQRVTLVR